MKIVAIIPARMGSSRFPGKPMALINGIPMIGHCYCRTDMCEELLTTYVATCDSEIFDYIKSINGNVVMTSPSHERACDRAAEAMLNIEKEINAEIDVVVMVQGDEPMLTSEMISESLKPIREESSVNIVNLMSEIQTIDEFEDPNEVKVVIDNFSNAIYFSREPIPSQQKFSGSFPMIKQVCIIPFRRNYLIKFNSMPETKLEIIESVDMMRIIENGEKIRMVMTKVNSLSVDTEYDLKRVRIEMLNDPLIAQYSYAKL
ncbi:3-deoxy-manno-octulosonate cytidylyltransferase [Candidatus Thioglobus sp.]|nr:3-deoxy-manno-octulosonate cytidylyltransferase [Candidatus Thioglobus sp.]